MTFCYLQMFSSCFNVAAADFVTLSLCPSVCVIVFLFFCPCCTWARCRYESLPMCTRHQNDIDGSVSDGFSMWLHLSQPWRCGVAAHVLCPLTDMPSLWSSLLQRHIDRLAHAVKAIPAVLLQLVNTVYRYHFPIFIFNYVISISLVMKLQLLSDVKLAH